MQWRIGTNWLVKTLRLTLLIEETVLVTLCNKKIKLEITT